jgi:hypothetical protein
VSSDNCKHVPSGAPQESLLGYTKINDFDLFLLLIVKDVLRFDVPMAHSPVMDVSDCSDNLLNYNLELFLRFNGIIC